MCNIVQDMHGLVWPYNNGPIIWVRTIVGRHGKSPFCRDQKLRGPNTGRCAQKTLRRFMDGLVGVFGVAATLNEGIFVVITIDLMINAASKNIERVGLKHNQRTSWFSTPHSIAEFKDGSQDAIKDGHLVVTVPVMITKKGYYNFDANLQAGSGAEVKFVGTSSVEGDFEPGAHTLEFQFWGKVLRDSGVDGPYAVTDIRGRRNNSPVTPSMVKKAMTENREISGNHTEPLWEYMLNAKDYTTRAYKSDDFSQEEWNSDEKRQRLEFLKNQIENE